MSLTHTHSIKENSNILFISLEGSIFGKEDATEVTELLEKEIENGNNQVLLDIEKLEYMNSTGINVLISYLTKCRNSGGELVIANVSPKVEQLLVITKLFSVFNVVNSTNEGFDKLLQTQEL